MKAYKHILALFDVSCGHQNALQKAAVLARKTGAHLTLLWVMQPLRAVFNKSDEPLSLLRQQLDDAVVACRKDGIPLRVKITENDREYKGVLEELACIDYDLLVKNNIHHAASTFGFNLSSDWHLLRETRVPLMLVGSKPWKSHGHILTAVEMEETSEQHLEFNRFLLEESGRIAELLEGDIHLLNCYLENDFGMAISAAQSEQHRQAHWQRLQEAARAMQPTQTQLHLQQGLADDGIPAVAGQCGASLVVLGAGEHTGLMSRFKGHTSEFVIEQLDCDVLALKPEPVRLSA